MSCWFSARQVLRSWPPTYRAVGDVEPSSASLRAPRSDARTTGAVGVALAAAPLGTACCTHSDDSFRCSRYHRNRARPGLAEVAPIAQIVEKHKNETDPGDDCPKRLPGEEEVRHSQQSGDEQDEANDVHGTDRIRRRCRCRSRDNHTVGAGSGLFPAYPMSACGERAASSMCSWSGEPEQRPRRREVRHRGTRRPRPTCVRRGE